MVEMLNGVQGHEMKCETINVEKVEHNYNTVNVYGRNNEGKLGKLSLTFSLGKTENVEKNEDLINLKAFIEKEVNAGDGLNIRVKSSDEVVLYSDNGVTGVAKVIVGNITKPYTKRALVKCNDFLIEFQFSEDEVVTISPDFRVVD